MFIVLSLSTSTNSTSHLSQRTLAWLRALSAIRDTTGAWGAFAEAAAEVAVAASAVGDGGGGSGGGAKHTVPSHIAHWMARCQKSQVRACRGGTAAHILIAVQLLITQISMRTLL